VLRRASATPGRQSAGDGQADRPGTPRTRPGGRERWPKGEGALNGNEGRDDSELGELAIRLAALSDPEGLKGCSKEIVAEVSNPANVGVIEDADGYGVADGLCGDTMTMFVSLDGDIVSRCTFTTDGCGPTIACGSRLTRLVSGMRTEDAIRVSPNDISGLLGGLPEDHEHCAALAVLALRNALRDAGIKDRRRTT